MGYVSIDEKSRVSGNNYNLEGLSCINTQALVSLDEENCLILLHANDVRHNKTLRDQIIQRMQEKKWSIFLFTNDPLKGEDIKEFSPSIVYTWTEIRKSFPILPPPDKKQNTHLIALSILCQGYLAAHWEEINSDKKESLSGLKALDTLPQDLKNKVKANKNKTVGQDWWEPAFSSNDLQKENFDDTEVGKELKSLGKDCEKNEGAIKPLFDAIKGLNGNASDDFTGKVIAVYDCTKKILGK